MNYYEMADIKCPFFSSETDKGLTCDVNKGIKNIMRFESCKQKLCYIREHCVNFPNDCHLFKAAWQNAEKDG